MLIMINTLMINFSSFNDHWYWLSLVVSGCLSVVICPSIQILVSLKKLPVFNQNPLLKDHPFNNYCSTFHIHFTCIKKPPVFRDYSLTLLWSDYEYRFDCSYNIDLTVVMLTTRQKEHVSTLLLSIHLLTTIFDFMQENIWKIINHNHSNSRIQLYIIVNNEIK